VSSRRLRSMLVLDCLPNSIGVLSWQDSHPQSDRSGHFCPLATSSEWELLQDLRAGAAAWRPPACYPQQDL
jgi:hypothetical protein